MDLPNVYDDGMESVVSRDEGTYRTTVYHNVEIGASIIHVDRVPWPSCFMTVGAISSALDFWFIALVGRFRGAPVRVCCRAYLFGLGEVGSVVLRSAATLLVGGMDVESYRGLFLTDASDLDADIVRVFDDDVFVMDCFEIIITQP